MYSPSVLRKYSISQQSYTNVYLRKLTCYYKSPQNIIQQINYVIASSFSLITTRKPFYYSPKSAKYCLETRLTWCYGTYQRTQPEESDALLRSSRLSAPSSSTRPACASAYVIQKEGGCKVLIGSKTANEINENKVPYYF